MEVGWYKDSECKLFPWLKAQEVRFGPDNFHVYSLSYIRQWRGGSQSACRETEMRKAQLHFKFYLIEKIVSVINAALALTVFNLHIASLSGVEI